MRSDIVDSKEDKYCNYNITLNTNNNNKDKLIFNLFSFIFDTICQVLKKDNSMIKLDGKKEYAQVKMYNKKFLDEEIEASEKELNSLAQIESITDLYERYEFIKRELGNVYAEEFRLKMIFKMHLRNITCEKMALIFRISVRTVYRLIDKLKKRLSETSAQVDINYEIAEAISFYKDIAAEALRNSDAVLNDDTVSKGKRYSLKLKYLKLAMNARNAMSKVFIDFGVLDKKQYQPDYDHPEKKSAEQLQMLAAKILKGEKITDEDISGKSNEEEFDWI